MTTHGINKGTTEAAVATHIATHKEVTAGVSKSSPALAPHISAA